MKKEYLYAQLEIIELNADDIVVTSDNTTPFIPFASGAADRMMSNDSAADKYM